VEDMQPFLTPTQVIESDHPRIRDLAGRIGAGAKDEADRARLLFEWTRDSIRYTVYAPFHLPEHYRPTTVLDWGAGYCVQKAVLLVSLARASGIPARLVFADIVNHRTPEALAEMMGSRVFTYHAYAELHLDGRWLQATPAFDRRLCEERGFPLVAFDGTADAIFPAHDDKGRAFVEYVRHHGSFADLPLERILAAWEETYGAERVGLWRQASESGSNRGQQGIPG